jgi:hypothetical protein
MAKQAYVYSGTDWVPLASEVTNLSNYYTKGEIDILDAPTGLKKVIPTSVVVGSGTGSVSSSGTVNFSGSSSVSIVGVFNATYTQYRINLNLIGTGASERDLNFRYLSGTTPNTSAQYRQQEFVSGGGTGYNTRTTGLTSHRGARCSNATKFASIIDIFFPFQTERTQAFSTQMGAPTGNLDLVIHASEIDVATSYDGIQFFPSGDNITGSISILGYNN